MQGQFSITRTHAHLRRALAGLAALALLSGCGSADEPEATSPRASTTPATVTSPTPTSPPTIKSWSGKAPTLAKTPVRVKVGSAGIDASIVDVDVDGKGVLTSPKGKAGWYSGEGAVVPGEPGTSIIVGHVTYNEPDVFYTLKKAEPGDRITVEFEGGRSLDFVVTDTAKFDQDDNIVDKVWEQTDQRLLRLVTCDGQRSSAGYTDNLIVYAERA